MTKGVVFLTIALIFVKIFLDNLKKRKQELWISWWRLCKWL